MDRHKFTINKAELEQTILLLLETRSEESFDLVDSVLIMKYYTMALEDIFYNLTGSSLNLIEEETLDED